jgi:hypothetical protein
MANGPQHDDTSDHTADRSSGPVAQPCLAALRPALIPHTDPEHGIVENMLEPLREPAQIPPSWTIQIKARGPVAGANAHAGALLFAQQLINQSMTATNGLMCCPSAEDQNLQQARG